MKIAITGAGGFIGKAIMTALAPQYSVLALSRTKPVLIANTTHITFDITDPDAYDVLPQDIDVIIHLAQSARYRDLPAGLPDLMDVNVAGFARLMEFARKTGVSHVINFSTGSVYEPNSASFSELDQIAPDQPYPASKALAEKIASYYNQYLPCLSLRVFFPYGPDQLQGLIPGLIERVRSGATIDLQGDNGGMEICPLYIDDLCAIVVHALETRHTGILNVAGPEQLNLQQVGTEIGAQVGRKPVFAQYPNQQAAAFQPDRMQLEAFAPKAACTLFSEGLHKTLATR